MIRHVFVSLFLVSIVVIAACSSDEVTGNATSGTCDPGNPCTCTGDGDCARTCSGAGCSLTCNGNGGCSLACPKGGCTVSCNGGGGCRITECGDCKCTASGAGGGCLNQ